MEGSTDALHRWVYPSSKPRHPKAPANVIPVSKYGEEHYPEESVPADYTMVDDLGRKCRYILVFLVYNHKGERLQRISHINQSAAKSQPLTLFGHLIPVDALTDRGAQQVKSILKSKRRRDYTAMGALAPYPVVAYLEELVLEYGQRPFDCPAMWLRSRGGVYYRLEEPAGRYKKLFGEEKRRFDVCTRLLKTLQIQPTLHLEELINLIQFGHREPSLVPEIIAAHAIVSSESNGSGRESTNASTGYGNIPSEESEDGSTDRVNRQAITSVTLAADQHVHGQHADSGSRSQYSKACELLRSRRGCVREEITPWGERYRLYPPVSRREIILKYGQFVITQARIFGGDAGDWFSRLPALQQLRLELTRPAASIAEPSLPPLNEIDLDKIPKSFPRMWMKTCLHVFDPKPLPDYWSLNPQQQAAKPYAPGCDWLWSSAVVNSTQAPDDYEPLTIFPQMPILPPLER